jgi:hypothetical protein
MASMAGEAGRVALNEVQLNKIAEPVVSLLEWLRSSTALHTEALPFISLCLLAKRIPHLFRCKSVLLVYPTTPLQSLLYFILFFLNSCMT